MTEAMNQYRRSQMRLFWGDDSLRHLGAELARAGCSRSVLMCGKSLAARPELLSAVVAASDHRVVAVFEGVRSHSPLESVLDARDALRDAKADSIVALGGGSASVTARAANILYSEKADVRDLSTWFAADGSAVSPRLSTPKLEQFVLPTTATTSSGKAGSAVTEPGQGERFLLFDPKTRATAIIVDPVLALSTPSALIRDSALTALTVAIEGVLAKSANLLSNGILLGATRSLFRRLPELSEDQPQREVVLEVVLSGISAGDGADAAGGGLTTALSHVLGHQFASHNGVLDAILLPHVLRFMRPAAQSALADVGWALDCDPVDVEAALTTVLSAAGAPTRLRDVGIPADALPAVAQQALSEFSVRSAPRSSTQQSVATLLQEAW